MKTILMSMQPYWYYLILIGLKKNEVRKHGITGKIFAYCTKNEKSLKMVPEKDREMVRAHMGKVGMEFVCDNVERFDLPYPAYFDLIDAHTKELCDNACLSLLAAHLYIGTKSGYALHISNLKVYDKPKELGEFKNIKGEQIKRSFQSWGYCYE